MSRSSYEPICDPEAEQAFLGSILVAPEVMGRIANLIAPADFYQGAHGRIYKAMLDLYGRGEPVDLVTVSGHLKERGALEGGGGDGGASSPLRPGTAAPGFYIIPYTVMMTE